MGFVQPGQALVVVGTVHFDVLLDVIAEFLTNLVHESLAALVAHGSVGEVGVHAGAVPVALDGFRLQVHGDAVTLANALEQVSRNPHFVAGSGCALGENLVLPLAHHHLSVDALDVDAGIETDLQMFVDDLSADCVGSTDGSIEWALRPGETVLREAEREIGVRVPQDIFLLEAEPEIIIVVVNGGATVGFMRGAVGVENFAHDQPVVGADLVGIREQGNRLEEAIGVVAFSLLGR